jgi:hypothetical protein
MERMKKEAAVVYSNVRRSLDTWRGCEKKHEELILG